MASTPPEFRIENDSMGEVRVPADALYGAQTQRAVENFAIGAQRFQPGLIQALALVKSCAAQVNAQLGLLGPEMAAAIAKAADEIVEGAHYE